MFHDTQLNARRVRLALLLLLALALLGSCAERPSGELVLTGLNQPRGMVFDAAGNLYLAEAGGIDPAAVDRRSPIATNQSGRVLRVDPAGQVSTLADSLPFTHYVTARTDVGASDLALIGERLYLLTGEGDAPLSRSVLLVAPGASPEPVASILNFVMARDLFTQMMGSGGAAANPYAIAASPAGDALFVSDGASGRVFRVALDGAISVLAEVAGMPPLTGLAFGPDGRLYVCMFSMLPHSPGSGALLVVGEGAVETVAGGLTMPIDVAFDRSGALYLLEFSDGREPSDPYAANGGRLLRIGPGDERTVLLDRLNYPTAMAFAPDGDLYISVGGAMNEPGEGGLLRVPCAALGPEVCAGEG
jgi:sugar lactone lactonase YvrE